MSTVLKDLRHAVRQLANAPGFTLVAIITLALGIGANTAIFSVVDAVLLRPLPYPDSDRLVSIQERAPDVASGISLSPPNFVDLSTRTQSFERVGAYVWATFNVTGSTEPERLSGAGVTPSLLPTLGVEPLLGRWFTTEEGLPGRDDVALLSYDQWQ